MSKDFILPELAEGVTSATVTQVFVAEGDTVAEGQGVVELETEKAAMEVPCPFGGVVKKVLVNVGDEIKVGQAILSLDANGKAASTKQDTSKKESKQAKPQASPAAVKEPAQTQPPGGPTPTTTVTAAYNLAAHIPKTQRDVPAAPSVRRFAREIGIDISQVRGSGPGGRIKEGDVKAFAKALNTGLAVQAAVTPVAASKPLPNFSNWGTIRHEKMTNIRKKTAEHMSLCWSSIPHVTQFGKADISDLEKLRKKHSTKERKLTVTPFLVKVMANALKNFPQFNASIDMNAKEIIYKDYINIGVAVDTDRGLLVPVIRDVDKKSIFQITDELNEMAERARQGKIKLDELQGGSMTLTNLGGIGGTSFTPIINWPEVAILGVSRGGWEPKYENNSFNPHFTLPLSLSYDHRLIDGADGARFLMWVIEAVEQPFVMDLES